MLVALLMPAQQAKATWYVILAGDMILAGTVEAQTLALQDIKKTQNKHLANEIIELGLSTKALQDIRKIEDDTYKYLSNATNVVENLLGITECVELCKEIYDELGKMREEAEKTKVYKTIMLTLIEKEHTNIIKAATNMYNVISNIVLNGVNFDTKGMDTHMNLHLEKNKDKPVNLLNSYERTYIVDQLKQSLKSIRNSVSRLRWQLRIITLESFVYKLDYKTADIIYGSKSRAKNIVRKMNRTFGTNLSTDF